MFDVFLNKLFGKKDIDLHFDLEKVLIKKFFYLKNSNDLYVLICLWTGGLDYTHYLRKKIKKKKASFLEFKLSSEILHSDIEKTLSRFHFIKQQIKDQIKIFKQEYGFDRVHLIGISMACVTVLMVANHNSLINKIILVVPGGSLAESVWKGIRTQHLRKIVELNGINLEGLKKKWSSLAPKNNLDGVEGKETIVYFSETDKIIPGKFGVGLVNKMYKKRLLPVVHKNKYLGHYGTILKFFIFPDLGI